MPHPWGGGVPRGCLHTQVLWVGARVGALPVSPPPSSIGVMELQRALSHSGVPLPDALLSPVKASGCWQGSVEHGVF